MGLRLKCQCIYCAKRAFAAMLFQFFLFRTERTSFVSTQQTCINNTPRHLFLVTRISIRILQSIPSINTSLCSLLFIKKQQKSLISSNPHQLHNLHSQIRGPSPGIYTYLLNVWQQNVFACLNDFGPLRTGFELQFPASEGNAPPIQSPQQSFTYKLCISRQLNVAFLEQISKFCSNIPAISKFSLERRKAIYTMCHFRIWHIIYMSDIRNDT